MVPPRRTALTALARPAAVPLASNTTSNEFASAASASGLVTSTIALAPSRRA
jgi:hypothetical protein